MNHVHVRCPCCGADEPEHRYSLVHTSIVSCKKCSMSYVNPRASSEQIKQLLQNWAEEDVIDEERLRIAFEPATMKYYLRFLNALEKRRTTDSKHILDVGCSTGAFLSLAKEDNWDPEGLEIGKASAKFAREQLNLTVTEGTLYEAEFGAASFDAIACIEVIEHLEQPSFALERFHEWLTPGGLLLLTTPNFNSLYRRVFGNRWWVINCEDEHIVFFTPRTLLKLLEDNGFVVENLRIQGLDIFGMTKELGRRLLGKQRRTDLRESAIEGYYDSRTYKTTIKNQLEKLGLLNLVRKLLHAFYATFTWRWSPFKDWGEQIVIIARRQD